MTRPSGEQIEFALIAGALALAAIVSVGGMLWSGFQ